MNYGRALKIEIASYFWVFPIMSLIIDFQNIAVILFVVFIIHLVIGMKLSTKYYDLDKNK